MIDDENFISSSVTDMSVCGVIKKELWDVTSGVEAELDPNIFTETETVTQTTLLI